MMMMMRPSSRRFVQRVVTRTTTLQSTNRRQLPRIFSRNTESWRCFSSKESKEKDTAVEATVTFTDELPTEDTTEKESINVSEFTQEVPVTMPDMGESTAKVIKWYKEEGDLVKRNDVLCDIETEDFTFGLTVDDEEDGIMGTIVVPASTESNIDDGDLLCILLHRGDNTDSDESTTSNE